jgi:hypothetical protein
MTNTKGDIITAKIKNIYNSLHNSNQLGISITNELNDQTDKLKAINGKSNTIYENLIHSRNKLNRIALSIPTFNITFPFFFKIEENMINNKPIIVFHKQEDEMDEISNRLNNLKNIANDINIELNRQNQIFDKITSINNSSFEFITENNQKIKKLL